MYTTPLLLLLLMDQSIIYVECQFISLVLFIKHRYIIYVSSIPFSSWLFLCIVFVFAAALTPRYEWMNEWWGPKKAVNNCKIGVMAWSVFKIMYFFVYLNKQIRASTRFWLCSRALKMQDELCKNKNKKYTMKSKRNGNVLTQQNKHSNSLEIGAFKERHDTYLAFWAALHSLEPNILRRKKYFRFAPQGIFLIYFDWINICLPQVKSHSWKNMF